MDPKSFREVLDFAIRKEIDAASLYEIYSNLAKNPGVKKMFLELSGEEQKHKKMLEDCRAEDITKYELKSIPDLKIGDYSMEEKYDPQMSYQDALILAIKREEDSIKLYNNFVESAVDPKIKKLFQALVQEEKKHKLRLEKEYDDNIFVEG